MNRDALTIIGIVAVSWNGYIGKNNTIPWHIPEDLKHFKKVTTGHPVVMGRTTYESLGKLLPDRQNIILTTDRSFEVDDAIVIHKPEELFKWDLMNEEVYIIGGKQTYDAFEEYINEWVVSEIKELCTGDTSFYIDNDIWKEVSLDWHCEFDVKRYQRR